MSDLLKLIILILACYRLAQLISIDDGPFDILLKTRIKLGAYDYDKTGKVKTSLGRGLSCPHCVGIWVSVGVVLYAVGIGWYTLDLLPILVIAVAGCQSFLQEIVRTE